MEVRSILVSVGVGSQHSAARYAGQLAERFGAELIGLAAAEPALAFAGVDNAQVAFDYYATERKTIETMLERAEEQFRAAIPPSVAARWRGFVANPTEMLIDQARRCDLVVASSDDVPSVGEPLDPGHLILACGRPVLLVAKGDRAPTLDHMVIAWKDTREARRAVADAVPLLHFAKQVKLVTHSEGDVATETSSLTDMMDWLGRHGISAETQLVEQGEEFLDAMGLLSLTDIPDLIVAGGYGHSRFREWLFGGVTDDLLKATNVNRLLSN